MRTIMGTWRWLLLLVLFYMPPTSTDAQETTIEPASPPADTTNVTLPPAPFNHYRYQLAGPLSQIMMLYMMDEVDSAQSWLKAIIYSDSLSQKTTNYEFLHRTLLVLSDKAGDESQWVKEALWLISYDHQLDCDSGIHMARKAWEISSSAADSSDMIWALLGVGQGFVADGCTVYSLDSASFYFDLAHQLAIDFDAPSLIAQALFRQAAVASRQLRYGNEVELRKRAYDYWYESDDKESLVGAALGISYAEQHRGNILGTFVWLSKAYQLTPDTCGGCGFVCLQIGFTLLAIGEAESAEEFIDLAYCLEDTSTYYRRATSYMTLAYQMQSNGFYETALKYALKSIALSNSLGYKRNYLEWSIAAEAANKLKLPEAWGYLDSTRTQILSDHSNEDSIIELQSWFYPVLLTMYYDNGMKDSAWSAFEQGAILSERDSTGLSPVQYYQMIGIRYLQRNDYEVADRLFRDAYSLDSTALMKVDLEYDLALTTSELGHHQEAIDHIDRFLELVAEKRKQSSKADQIRFARHLRDSLQTVLDSTPDQ